MLLRLDLSVINATDVHGDGLAALLELNIARKLQDVEENARARLLGPHAYTIAEVLADAIRRKHSGRLYTDGGTVPRSYHYVAETTVLNVEWARWYHQLVIYLTANRAKAHTTPYGAPWNIDVENLNDFSRHWLLCHLANRDPDQDRERRREKECIAVCAALHRRHIPLPPTDIARYLHWSHILHEAHGGIVGVEFGFYYIGTPLGWLAVYGSKFTKRIGKHQPRWDRPWYALRLIGVEIPRRRKDRVWSREIATQLAVLKLDGGGWNPEEGWEWLV